MFSPTQPDSQNDPQSNKPKNDNLDDLFSSSPTPPQNQGPVDDLFSSPPSGNAPAGGPYTPPPPQPQQRRGNPILYIILGVVIALMCLCVGCIAIFGGSIFAVSQNPTFQAGFATGKAAVGTGMAMGAAPTALPSDATSKGILSANQQQSGSLTGFTQDVWTYNGKSGEAITINVTAQDSHQAVVAGLYGANGKLLIGTTLVSSIQPTQTLQFTLPADGTYSILVGALGGTAGVNGNYTIKVQSSAR